jgi:hypothetical protein
MHWNHKEKSKGTDLLIPPKIKGTRYPLILSTQRGSKGRLLHMTLNNLLIFDSRLTSEEQGAPSSPTESPVTASFVTWQRSVDRGAP